MIFLFFIKNNIFLVSELLLHVMLSGTRNMFPGSNSGKKTNGNKYYIIFAEEILYTAFILCISVKITFSTLLLTVGLRKYLTWSYFQVLGDICDSSFC